MVSIGSPEMTTLTAIVGTAPTFLVAFGRALTRAEAYRVVAHNGLNRLAR